MSIRVGTDAVGDIYLGTSRVKEIYLGTDKVYSIGSEVWTLWDNGPVSGITWGANTLSRGGYWGNMVCSVESATLKTELTTSSSTYSSCYFNGHFVLSDELVIPATATNMNVLIYCRTNGYGFIDSNSVQLGVIPKAATAASAFIKLGAGTCSGTSYNSLANAKTITVDCSAYAGASGYKPMIYFYHRPSTSNTRDVYIAKVWFT